MQSPISTILRENMGLWTVYVTSQKGICVGDLKNFLFGSSCICTSTKTAFHKHEVAALHTVKNWVNGEHLARSIILSMDFTLWVPDSRYWIPSLLVELEFWIPIEVGFRISWAVFRIPKPRILDFTTKLFSNSGIRIPLPGAMSCLNGFSIFSYR